jgi:hypothetical protein
MLPKTDLSPVGTVGPLGVKRNIFNNKLGLCILLLLF